jgi:hypothetical protein
MKWDIWRSGYIATGDRDNEALLHSGVEADTFVEACRIAFAGDKYFREINITWWACKLFPTQEEAHAVFSDTRRKR